MQNSLLESVKCDLCSTTFRTKSELDEHEWSLLHHIKLEKSSLQCQHVCNLCQLNCASLADFSKHLETNLHQSNETTRNNGKKLNNCFSLMNNNEMSRSWHYPSYYAESGSLSSSNSNNGNAGSSFQQNHRANQCWFDNSYRVDYQQRASFRKILPPGAGDYRSHGETSYYKNTPNKFSNNGGRQQQNCFSAKKPPLLRLKPPDSSMSYFEPDVPINAKNMAEIYTHRHHSFTKSSFKLNRKLEGDLKRQRKQETNDPAYSKHKSASVNGRNETAASGGSKTDSCPKLDKSLPPSSKKSKTDSSKTGESSKQHHACKGNKKSKRRNKKRSNSRAVSLPTTATPGGGDGGFIEADSTTSFAEPVEIGMLLPEIFGVPGSSRVSRSEPGKGSATSAGFGSKNANFMSNVKKAMKCPPSAASSADYSKRLLAERIKNYRVQTGGRPSVTPGDYSPRGRAGDSSCRSFSESSTSDVEVLDTLATAAPPAVEKSPTFFRPPERATTTDRSNETLRVQNEKKISKVVKNAVENLPVADKSSRSEIAAPPGDKNAEIPSNPCVVDQSGAVSFESNGDPVIVPISNGLALVSDDSFQRQKSSSSAQDKDVAVYNGDLVSPNSDCILNAIQVLKCEEDAAPSDEDSDRQDPAGPSSTSDDLGIPSSTIPQETSSSNQHLNANNIDQSADVSKLQLLWNCCRQEERVRAEIFSLHQELESLEQRVSLCRKRKLEAESEYRRIRICKQELLASASSCEESDQQRSGAGVASKLVVTQQQPPPIGSPKLTYLGIINSEPSLIKNLESSLGVLSSGGGAFRLALVQQDGGTNSSSGVTTVVKQET